MRKISAILLVVFMMSFAAACSSGGNGAGSAGSNGSEGSVSVVTTEPLTPIYAKDIKDGEYEITVHSSSSMFRVVNCVLTVKKGKMTALMTLSGQGYESLYMGTGEQALADSKDKYIPFKFDKNGAKTHVVPVEALDKEIDCAAFSIRKQKWYDRVLIFESDQLPEDALK